MTRRSSAKHAHRDLLPEERTRVAATRTEAEQDEAEQDKAEQDKAEILRMAKQYPAEANAERARMREALQVLKAERIYRGLSLAAIQERTGIEPLNRSRLENEPGDNPSIATLIRSAEALKKRLRIVRADRPPATSGGHG